MIITEDMTEGSYIRKAYEPGKITVNESTYTQSLIISKNQLTTDWEPQSIAQLNPSHFDAIVTLQPEIVLLGTGIAFHLPEHRLLAPLYEKGFGVECMDTGAACRTFTALLSEKRNVIAALLIQ